MSYKYEFNKDKCWYKPVCNNFNKRMCNKLCIRYFEMHYLMNNSGLPYKQQLPKELNPGKEDRTSFKELQKIKDNVVNFVNNGDNLYIYSKNCGNGKTSWAVRLLTKYFDEIWLGNGLRCRGLFINVPMFISKTKSTISRPDKDFELLKERALTTDLIIWDDIAATKLSDFDYNNLLTYIDSRLFDGLSNIYTGNLIENQLEDTLGQRLKSRIWNESKKIELKSGDWRGI